MAELMKTSQPYTDKVDMISDKKDRKLILKKLLDSRYLAVGDSCYPLSPLSDDGKEKTVSIKD